MIYLGMLPVGVVPEGTESDWQKPIRWPNIESIALPGSTTENTIYFLYDKSCGVDTVSISVGINGSFSIYKGTVKDGAFDGYLVGENLISFVDTLLDDYTVYCMKGRFDSYQLRYGVKQQYTPSIQGLVWVYGEAPVLTGLGGVAEYTAPFSIHTQRFVLKNTFKLTNLTFPDMGSHTLSWYLGAGSNGDFNGNTLVRTGNGQMFYQSPDNAERVVIQNASVDFSAGRFTMMRDVAFQQIRGKMNAQSFQEARYLKRITFAGSEIECLSMNQQFSGCGMLEECDLYNVDFSGAVNSVNAFQGCGQLKTLHINSTWSMDLNLFNCLSLSKESVIEIMNVLPTVNTVRTLTLPYGFKAYL